MADQGSDGGRDRGVRRRGGFDADRDGRPHRATFTIADAGVYLFEFAATYPADGDRSTPFVEIQQDSDDAVIGRSTSVYVRNTGNLDDTVVVVAVGVVTVPSADLVVKAVLGNAYNTNNLDADGGKLSLVRIGTGLDRWRRDWCNRSGWC